MTGADASRGAGRSSDPAQTGRGTDLHRQVSNWNLPNALTVLRILLVPVFGWLLLAEGGSNPVHRWAALAVFIAAMLTDSLDGRIARSRNLVTDFGKIADPIADKALTGMAFIGLSIVGSLWWWVTVVILIREWGITLMRFIIIRYGVMPAGRGGKLKTVLQSVALGILIAPVGGIAWALGVATMGAALVVTVVTGIDYVLQAKAMVGRLRSGTTA